MKFSDRFFKVRYADCKGGEGIGRTYRICIYDLLGKRIYGFAAAVGILLSGEIMPQTAAGGCETGEGSPYVLMDDLSGTEQQTEAEYPVLNVSSAYKRCDFKNLIDPEEPFDEGVEMVNYSGSMGYMISYNEYYTACGEKMTVIIYSPSYY